MTPILALVRAYAMPYGRLGTPLIRHMFCGITQFLSGLRMWHITGDSSTTQTLEESACVGTKWVSLNQPFSALADNIHVVMYLLLQMHVTMLYLNTMLYCVLFLLAGICRVHIFLGNKDKNKLIEQIGIIWSPMAQWLFVHSVSWSNCNSQGLHFLERRKPEKPKKTFEARTNPTTDFMCITLWH